VSRHSHTGTPSVGEAVAMVGEAVGELVGEDVGELVGEDVGEDVGELVGEDVGEAVGELVGEDVAGSQLVQPPHRAKPQLYEVHHHAQ